MKPIAPRDSLFIDAPGDDVVLQTNDRTYCGGRHFYGRFWDLLVEMGRGRSLYRACTYSALRRVRVHGNTLDIGARSEKSEYFTYLRTDAVTGWTAAGLESSPRVVFADLTQRLPFDDAAFDSIVALNVLEHCSDWEHALSECRRVMRKAGRAIVVIPFIHEIHNDPGDFVRLTPQGVVACAQRVGFGACRVWTLGEGLLTFVAAKISQHLVPSVVRRHVAVATFVVAYPLDCFLRRRAVGGMTLAERFALGVVAELRR